MRLARSPDGREAISLDDVTTKLNCDSAEVGVAPDGESRSVGPNKEPAFTSVGSEGSAHVPRTSQRLEKFGGESLARRTPMKSKPGGNDDDDDDDDDGRARGGLSLIGRGRHPQRSKASERSRTIERKKKGEGIVLRSKSIREGTKGIVIRPKGIREGKKTTGGTVVKLRGGSLRREGTREGVAEAREEGEGGRGRPYLWKKAEESRYWVYAPPKAPLATSLPLPGFLARTSDDPPSS